MSSFNSSHQRTHQSKLAHSSNLNLLRVYVSLGTEVSSASFTFSTNLSPTEVGFKSVPSEPIAVSVGLQLHLTFSLFRWLSRGNKNRELKLFVVRTAQDHVRLIDTTSALGFSDSADSVSLSGCTSAGGSVGASVAACTSAASTVSGFESSSVASGSDSK